MEIAIFIIAAIVYFVISNISHENDKLNGGCEGSCDQGRKACDCERSRQKE